MKKIILLLVFVTGSLFANSQNIQTHYDFGKDRNYVTTTVEMFKPDEWGSTFFFVDFNYDGKDNSASLAYWEIARDLKFWDAPIALHVELNAGKAGFPIENAYLAGLSYSINAKDFSKGITFQAMYKNIKGKEDLSFQLTTVWYLNMFDNKLTFTGFMDFWKEDMYFGTEYRFITEPQLWYNATKHLSLGSEVEISNNFAQKGFLVCPTLALKWKF